jgi:hypothetical protein
MSTIYSFITFKSSVFCGTQLLFFVASLSVRSIKFNGNKRDWDDEYICFEFLLHFFPKTYMYK